MDFFDMLGEMFKGGWEGILVGVIILTFLAVLLALCAWAVLFALDSWLLPERRGPGVITGKYHTPARVMLVPTVIPSGSGGTSTILLPQYLPENWSVSVGVDGRAASMSCSEYYYERAREGMSVRVRYVKGRITGRPYIRALS